MAKKARRTAASKARRAKASGKKKQSAANGRRIVVAPKETTPVARTKSAGKPDAKPSESLLHKIAGAFKGVVDTLTEAEQLHRRLDPDPTRDIDPE